MIGGATGSLLTTLISFLAVLTVVVFVHELGHFWVGRRCGVGVNAFSIGFGPELWGLTDRHGTRWKFSAIPLGGYVKFVGDMNAASMPDQGQLDQLSAAGARRELPAQERRASAPRSSRPDRSPISSSRSRFSPASTTSTDARSSSRGSNRSSRAAPPNGPVSSPAT